MHTAQNEQGVLLDGFLGREDRHRQCPVGLWKPSLLGRVGKPCRPHAGASGTSQTAAQRVKERWACGKLLHA